MKTILPFICFLITAPYLFSQNTNDTTQLKKSLDKATLTIRNAFEKGDAELIVKLHSPNIEKYFGGSNVVIGRENLKKGLQDWFQNSKVEFIENTVESTIFNGETAIETVVFGFKTTPKNGGTSVISRGRSMVVYIQDKTSPTGWITLREMAQEAPTKEK
ncbi:nuclear transport factor 2 family protein [Flavobacterium collinsii]|uniref:YybH family protein n=1 Tax=Flavobacterium collinsii TaxID=1114861 RepID=UPI0022C62DCD|nr:nuclear transport factor 2 family protein [Flavobacterium collinsii]GIQ59970.1 hypothetical protein Flavo103_31060 [Flavobacterium collinsii]